MTRMFSASVLTLATALTFLASLPATTLADTMKSESMKGAAMPAIDCKKADTMMMKMAHSDDAMMPAKMSGDADKDFAKMMMVHHSEMVAMAKVEAKCGKTAQMRAEAQKMLERLNQIKADLEMLSHSP